MKRALVLAAVAAILPACTPSADDEMTLMDAGIETFPSEGSTHVPVGTAVVYNTDPPTSGNHYPDPQAGGYYTSAIAPGFLVHSLEHGGIVIYYDSAVVAPADLTALQNLAAQHPGSYNQVIAVPRTDATYPVIVTAWTHRLRLTQYDQTRIDGFVTLFIGKGPEQQP